MYLHFFYFLKSFYQYCIYYTIPPKVAFPAHTDDSLFFLKLPWSSVASPRDVINPRPPVETDGSTPQGPARTSTQTGCAFDGQQQRSEYTFTAMVIGGDHS